MGIAEIALTRQKEHVVLSKDVSLLDTNRWLPNLNIVL